MKIAYVRNTFPKATETFILEEILYLAKAGHDVRIHAARCELANMNPKLVESGLLANVVFADASAMSWRGRFRLVRMFLRKIVRYKPYRTRFLHDYFPERDLGTEFDDAMRAAGAGRWRRQASVWLNAMRLNNLSLARHQYVLDGTEFVPDHIHCPFLFAGDCATLDELTTRYPDSPYTVTLRSRDLYFKSTDTAYLATRDRLIHGATRVFAISEFNKREIAARYALQHPVQVVHSSIDTDYFRPGRTDKKKARKLIAVARLVPKKGLELLIDACVHLDRAGAAFHLSIVGSGMLRDALLEQIRQHGLQDKIEIIGPFKSDMVRYLLDCAEIFVLPCVVAGDGDRDMLPNSLKEAMAMKLAVVTTNISGIEELITDGVDGFLVAPNNAANLAATIAAAFADRESAKRIGERARKKVVANYSIQVEGKKFLDALERIHRHVETTEAALVE
jgi:glycosyltransferase involved in cell wall biosynthesis